MSALTNLLQSIEKITLTNRDKGTSFENLMVQYFLNEPKYAELYTEVLSYADWVEKYGEKLNITDKRDYGIDLVAVTMGGEFHPIQCKNYNTTKIQKKDIDSFLGGSGKSYFAYRYIVASTDDWTDNAKSSLVDANQRTSGERSRQEGGKIFGGGSRAPIVIAVLVKNPNAKQHGQIYFHDIGDYLSREEKLEKISDLVSINGITTIDGWSKITPDEHNDWLNQRDDSFNEFIEIGNKKDKDTFSLFDNFSIGVVTNRDAWIYQYSKNKLNVNVNSLIDFYNSEINRIQPLIQAQPNIEIGDLINNDSTKISWTRALKNDLKKSKYLSFDTASIYTSTYRPFTKSWMYFNRRLNEMVYQIPKIFPISDSINLTIFTNIKAYFQ